MGVLQSVELDADLHCLIIAELINMYINQGLDIVVPNATTIQQLLDAQFYTYRTLLSSITTENRS